MKKKFYEFPTTSFNNLMAKRIHTVLIVCSTYDFFTLEEDGRIDEQIFNEYVSLNLRYPPQFIHASSGKEAFEKLENENIDLVITMLSIGDMEPFSLSNEIKKAYTEIPIVVLTPFSLEVTMRLSKEDLSAIDYVFSWLGNTNLLLAIIKLIEDKASVEHDVKEVGVQVIILVEDSIRFYSSYLPIIYNILFEQSQEFTIEGLNEHQKMMRKRGRAKILLATNYEDALRLYEKYEDNLLGVISDVNYPRQNRQNKYAGISFVKKIKKRNPLLPILLQSSDKKNKDIAKKIHVGFINKNSKNLLHHLKKFILKYFAFGDFEVKDPRTNEIIMQFSDLKSLQKKIYEIPDDSLIYHLKRNHFSKWLKARALFDFGSFLRNYEMDNFDDIDKTKKFIYNSIECFRKTSSTGIIAKFYRKTYDTYLSFARIGEGSLGGKARGLAFLNSMIKKHHYLQEFENITVSIPQTVVLTTDVFDAFIKKNDLYYIYDANLTDDEILERFVRAYFPVEYKKDLEVFIKNTNSPIAVRSSSKLEDAHYQPFAGVYSTYMIANTDDSEQFLKMLILAIKSVYASVYFKESRGYMTATSNVIDEEKMAIVLQEVCGSKYDDLYYPTISGVARSVNFYPIGSENAEDGIVNIAFGLGKQIVEGGKTIRFSPKHPDKILEFHSNDSILKNTQKRFFALDLNADNFVASIDDAVNLKELRVKEIENNGSIDFISSVYDYSTNSIKDGSHYEGKKIITFNNILKYNAIPIHKVLQKILKIGVKEMNTAIEIEFAINIKDKNNAIFNILQIRPIVENDEIVKENLDEIKEEETIIYSKSALGNGVIENIYDLVYVKPKTFDSKNNTEIAERIGKLNETFIENGKKYILVGPGRWGSRDKWLGIPVKWTNISAARLIVESGLENYRIDPSQGTHFFQNLTSFKVGYFTINPYIKDGYYNLEYLNKQEATYEDEFIRHIKFTKPVCIKIDGRKKIGVVIQSMNNE